MPDAKTPTELSMEEILAKIRHIIAEDEHAGDAGATGRPAAGGGLAAADEEEEDVLELTEAIDDDGSTRHLIPLGGSQGGAGREPPPAEREEERREPPPPSMAAEPEQRDDRLVSDAAAAAASGAFGRLSGMRQEPAAPAPQPMVGDRPLEEVVRDLLRPLLKSWLDDNLPELVERLVRAEIARIAGRAGPH